MGQTTSPQPPTTWPHAGLRHGAVVAAAVTLAGLVLPGAVGAWTTNATTLDSGVCGRNLQLGSNLAATTTARPTFLLQGDGGLSSYAISIDGKRLGTFKSRGDAVVCIPIRVPLAEGAHLLTGTELSPHRGWTTRLRFWVDTRPPKPPSRPAVAAYSDVGSDGYQTVTVGGTAAPNQLVQISSNGTAGIAGARTDATGRWSATTVRLAAGTYRLAAVTVDSAGNRSSPSGWTEITIKADLPPG